jgi:hypothetical protein
MARDLRILPGAPSHWLVYCGPARATADTLAAAQVAARILEAEAGQFGANATVVGPLPGRASESEWL